MHISIDILTSEFVQLLAVNLKNNTQIYSRIYNDALLALLTLSKLQYCNISAWGPGALAAFDMEQGICALCGTRMSS